MTLVEDATLPIARRVLGSTGLEVCELGFGGAALGNLYQPLSDAESMATIDTAYDAGLRHFDTAPYYGFGLGERRLGNGLRKHPRDSYVLSTKVGRLLEPVADPAGLPPVRHGFHAALPFEPVFDYSYDGIMRSVEASVRRIGLERIDILYIHDIGRVTHGARHDVYLRQLIAGGYRALDTLRSEGTVEAIGLGVNEWEACLEAMEIGRFDAFLLAGRYTLLEQTAFDRFLPRCAAHGASVIVGGVYNSGILATGTGGAGTLYYDYAPAPVAIVKRVRLIERICEAYGVTLAAAALQFPLAHPQVAAVIPGARSSGQVTKSLRLYREKIPAAFWAALLREGLIRADVPTPVSAS